MDATPEKAGSGYRSDFLKTGSGKNAIYKVKINVSG
jgi:hypothetical protein